MRDPAVPSRLSRILISHGAAGPFRRLFRWKGWSAPPHAVATHSRSVGATLIAALAGTAGGAAGVGCGGAPYQRECGGRLSPFISTESGARYEPVCISVS